MAKPDKATRVAIDERVILRLASQIIATHGERAWARCAERAHRLRETGDLEAARLCRRLLATIEDLQSRERPHGVTTH